MKTIIETRVVTRRILLETITREGALTLYRPNTARRRRRESV